jgi:Mrp family chromosome partitioning ATPase
MSRIADVLQKARTESATRQGVRPDSDDSLRPIADVRVPWSLQESTSVTPPPPNVGPPPSNVVPSPSLVHPRDARMPAPERRPSLAHPRIVSGPASTPAPSQITYDPQAIERLVQDLFLAARTAPAPSRVLLTTAEGSRGCAEMAPLVAEALAARVSGTVCLADLDLQNPTLSRRYPLDGKLSLAEVLNKSAPLIDSTHRAPSIVNLWLLPASLASPGTPAPPLHDLEVRARLRELFGTFDYVVAFTGPIGVQPDATFLGHALDGVVLLVDANLPKSERVSAAADLLRREKLRLLGTVVNKGSA